MATVEFKIPNTADLGKFYSENRDKTIRMLRAKYSALGDDDIEDIFQDASLALFENIQSGRLEELTSSLFSYFITICNNQASKRLRHTFDHVSIDENRSSSRVDYNDDDVPVLQSKMDELDCLIGECGDVEERYTNLEARDAKMRECVKNMKEPCNHVLWGLYWDNFSHQTIAQMYGYKSANVSKVTASRCKDKFSKFLKASNILL